MTRRIVAARNMPPESVMHTLIEAECPDCDADYVLREDEATDRIWHLDVAHDETCPAYLGLTGGRE